MIPVTAEADYATRVRIRIPPQVGRGDFSPRRHGRVGVGSATSEDWVCGSTKPQYQEAWIRLCHRNDIWGGKPCVRQSVSRTLERVESSRFGVSVSHRIHGREAHAPVRLLLGRRAVLVVVRASDMPEDESSAPVINLCVSSGSLWRKAVRRMGICSRCGGIASGRRMDPTCISTVRRVDPFAEQLIFRSSSFTVQFKVDHDDASCRLDPSRNLTWLAGSRRSQHARCSAGDIWRPWGNEQCFFLPPRPSSTSEPGNILVARAA